MAVLESRLAGSFKSAMSVAGWSVVAVATLTGSSLAIAWIVTLFRDGSFTSGDNVVIGLACSLIALLFIGVFHLRKETVQLRISDGNKFRSRMQVILQDLGYQTVARTEKCWRTRPQFRALLFGGGITLKLEGSKAAITGPRLSLELIRRRYRLASHLDKVQESISDSKARMAVTFLKRLELNVRFEPEQMEEFQKKVVDVLSKNGSLVVDLNLMLISEDGMREGLWSNEMRPWLDENHIPYEFHRDHAQRSTLAGNTGSGEHAIGAFVDTCMWS